MWTSLLTRPNEDTVSLIKPSSERHEEYEGERINLPDPHKMYPHTRPTKKPLELYCRLPRLGEIGVDGEITEIGPVVIY